MNISQAKQIPLAKIVEHLGGRFAYSRRAGETWYYSPFRPDEKTASFKIDEKNNTWHDFGLSGGAGLAIQGSGGDCLDLYCDFHNLDRRSGIKDALNSLKDFSAATLPGRTKQPPPASKSGQETIKPPPPEAPRYQILKIQPKIFYESLKEELHRRGIPLELASRYLKQGYIVDTKTDKKYNGFLFKNDKDGYEISIPNPAKGESFKTSVSPKASTSIPGLHTSKNIDVFEGVWDFLTWLQINKLKTPKNHAEILNSLSFCGEVANKIITRKDDLDSIFLFMDNDEAGFLAMHKMAAHLEPEGFNIGSKSNLYDGYKDLNDYWIKQPEALQSSLKTNEVRKVYYDTAWNQVQNKNSNKPT